MSLMEYTLLAFGSLFAIVDPIAVMPAFVTMTVRDSQAEQIRMVRLACMVAAGVLIAFVLTGPWIFKLLGVTLPAFQIAGSVLLFCIALDMLYAKRTAARETVEEVEAGAAKDDIAVTPLGVPMLAGPGAISAVLILRAQAQGVAQHVALIGCILLVCVSAYLILRFAVHGAHRLNPLVLKLAARLMGLLLAAVAAQFALNALRQLGVPLTF
ncbi:MAG TPA: NAAT family transporter [Luteolibacter sp.]